MLNRLKKQAYANISLDLQKVLINITWLFVDQFIQIGMAFGVGIWVARYLGPAEFGLLSYAMAFVSLFFPFIDLGLRSLVVRDISRDPDCKQEVLGTTFVLQLLSACVCIPLTIGIAARLPNEKQDFLLYVVIISVGLIALPFDTIDYWFQSQVKSKYVVVAKNSSFLLISLFRIALIHLRASTVLFAWGRFIEFILNATSLVIAYLLKAGSPFVWRASLSRARSLLNQCWPIVFASLTHQIYSKIDQVMLGSMLEDTSQLAFYSVAVKLAEVFNFLPMMIAASVLPKLTEMRAETPDRYRDKFQVYFDIMLLMGIAIAIPISLLSPWIIDVSYGQYYAPSASLLAVYIWAQIGTNFGVARGTWFVIEGKLKWSLYVGVIGAIMNILLNFYLIPQYEAMGATVATLITFFVVSVAVNFLFRDLHFVAQQIFRALNCLQAVSRVVRVFR